MSTPSKPLRLTSRHHRLAELAVLGLTNNEIADRLHYTPARVSVLLNHPDINAMVVAMRTTYRDRSLGTLHDDLAKDATNTFAKLKQHRDAEDPDVSLKACTILFDRQIPKRTVHDETHITKIVLERRDIVYLEQVAAEDDGVVEAEGEVLDGPEPTH
jgi:hypothetical protein